MIAAILAYKEVCAVMMDLGDIIADHVTDWKKPYILNELEMPIIHNQHF